MGFFGSSKSGTAGNSPDQGQPGPLPSFPWDRGPSIFDHIAQHLDADGRLPAEAETLPDHERVDAGGGLRWVAGGRDGAWSHHGGPADQDQTIGQLLAQLARYCAAPTALNKLAVYEFVRDRAVLDVIDPLIERLGDEDRIDPSRLYDLAKTLVVESPDREPVKFGLAIMGLFAVEGQASIFATIGSHEEFTLFAAVALAQTSAVPERDLWHLARRVDGWGRIHVVERLAECEDPEIREWLLREGYRNDIMDEYLAYTCATAGDLRAALVREEVDDGLFEAARDLIVALIQGGPAQDLDDYRDGAEVVARFVDLTRERQQIWTLADFIAIGAIHDWVADGAADWAERAIRGWSEDHRLDIIASCRAMLDDPAWPAQVEAGLASEDPATFHRADQAARRLDIPTWDVHWRRLQAQPMDENRWFHVMRLCTSEAIVEVLALAEATLPLAQIATGPGDEWGFGDDYRAHRCLDFILQDLGRFPDSGGLRLVEAGLASPVVRNRNMAARALADWGRTQWPHGAEALLQAAIAVEPDEQVRTLLERTLTGEASDETLDL